MAEVGGGPPSAAPKRAGLVLVSLILVAAVANLNLSVANVALPSIGEAFDSSQTTLNLIAVGYSLGLAASVLWLGAIGDRYGRKLLLVLGMVLSDPGISAGGVRAVRRGALRRPSPRRTLGRHGLPDDARSDHGALGRAGTHEGDRALVRDRRRHRRSRAAGRRRAAGGVLVGIGLPRHAPARRRRSADGARLRARPRQRDDRSRGQPGGHPLGRPGRDADPGDQLRARCRTWARWRWACWPWRSPRPSRSSFGSAARRIRSTTSRSPPPHLLGRRVRRGSSSSAR